MFDTKSKPDVLNLLGKLQESTVEGIDEERGSFKKGNKVIYDMFGSGLTNSDIIKTLDTNEHATRTNHNETVAEVVEVIGEAVSRYSIMFEDGFVINDVAASELKSVNEAEDATDTMKPQEKPNINAEDYHMEDYSDEEFNKLDVKVKSKSEKSGDAIRAVDDEELMRVPDEVVTLKKESKLKEQEDIDSGELNISVQKSKISRDMYGKSYADLTEEEAEIVDREFFEKKNESKIREQEHPSDNLTIGDTVEVLRGRYKGQVGEIDNITSPDEDLKEMPEGQIDVEMPDGTIRYLGWDDVKLVESKLKEEEFTPSRSEMSKVTDEKLKELHKNALRSLKYWEKDGTDSKKVELVKKAVARYEEAMVDRGLMPRNVPSEKKESKFSFMKKQKPLWLCNECFKTFRSDKNLCENCKSENVEKITEQYGAGFTKEVFKVTWKNTDTGKEESTTVMAFDKADAKKEAKRSNREITKAEGPITKEPRKEESKVPFDNSREELTEDVQELVREVPGIDKEEQEILLKAIEDGIISNEWPTDEEMVNQFIEAEIDPNIAKDEDIEDFRFAYLKHILLTKAMKVTRVAKESRVNEQEKEGVPEKGKTYQIYQKLGMGLPKGTYEVTNVEYRKTTKGDLAKQFQVAETDSDRWWTAKFYSFKELVEEAKEFKPIRTIEIVKSEVDPDVYNIRVVELPEGDITNYATAGDKELAQKKGEDLAQKLNAKFLGFIDEKIKESQLNILEEVENIGKIIIDKVKLGKWGVFIAFSDEHVWPAVVTTTKKEAEDLGYDLARCLGVKEVDNRIGTEFESKTVSKKNYKVGQLVGWLTSNKDRQGGIIEEVNTSGIRVKLSDGSVKTVVKEQEEDKKKVEEKKLKDFTDKELKSLIRNIKRVVNMFPADVEADPSRLAKLEAEITRRDKIKKLGESESKLKEVKKERKHITPEKYQQLIKQARENFKISDYTDEQIEKLMVSYATRLLRGVFVESKLKEQEEDTFKTVAKGFTDRADADKLAKEKEGQVIQDEEDETKFAVVTKVK